MSQRLSRRRFLGGSVRFALGATGLAVAGEAGLLAEADGAGASRRAEQASRGVAGRLTVPPPEPPGFLRFVSRPDLRPPGVSIVTVPGYRPAPSTPRYIFLGPREVGSLPMPAGSQRGLMIADRLGRLIWFAPKTANGEDPLDFRVQTYKGQPVLTWWQGYLGPGYGDGGVGILMDSTYTEVASVQSVGYPMDLHELTLTPQGTALVTAYEQRKRLTIGHAQEVDIASGSLVFDWPSYPSVAPRESYVSGLDYFHINSIDLWPGAERNLLVSSRNCCAVYLVERATKKILWRLHGKRSTFRMSASAQFWFQHDARALANGRGISVFDDASQPCPEHQSWAKVVHIDFASKTAALAEQYRHETVPLDVSSQGNNQLLPDGSRFVGFGAAPYFSQYAAPRSPEHSAMLLDGRLPNDVESYRAFSCDWVGDPPLSEIALVVRKGSAAGELTAYVSWNGATEVHVWRIQAGPNAAQLRGVGAAFWSGFETVVPVTASGARYFRAKAYAANGELLGESAVVEAR